jgi:hypothetical protein
VTSQQYRYRSDWEETAGGKLTSLPGYGGSPALPLVGDEVELFDDEGNTCYAHVDQIGASGLILLTPHWATWRDAPKRRNFPDPITAMVGDLINETRTSTEKMPALNGS